MILFASAVVLLLVVVNGVFAMSEMAVVSARRARLQLMAERGNGGAKAALRLAEDPTRFLSSVQVGITLIGILAGAYGQATIAHELDVWLEHTFPPIAQYSEPIATGIVVVIITYLSLIVGELVPKRLALIHPESLAATLAPLLGVLSRLLHPAVSLLTMSTAGVLALLRVKDGDGSEVTQEEVESVLAEGAGAGVIEPEERSMIQEVMRLGDRPARVAMTPRTEIYWVSLADDEAQIRADILRCPYSRFVVTEGADLDAALGVVHKRDVADRLLGDGPLDLPSLIHQPLTVPQGASLLRALEAFKHSPTHVAFIVDEYGGLQGLLTPTDLLEMIAGDMPESHDTEAPAATRRADGSYLVDGRMDVVELGDLLGATFPPSETFHTAAGLVLTGFGHLPKEGESLTMSGWRIEVLDMDGRRVDKLLFTRAPRS